MTPLLTASKQQQAMLDMISVTEGTSSSLATKNRGYDVIVTGVGGQPEIFTDYSHHPFDAGRPAKVINHSGLQSTASGRYQILLRWWRIYAKQNGWPDFTPLYQDQYALVQFRERHVLASLDAGNFHSALRVISPLWASLPGKGYVGQGQRTIAFCEAVYRAKGGAITDLPIPI